MNHLPKFFFSVLNNIRMYHWQTNTYARHIATDQLLTQFEPLVDNFMEVYQGKYSKLPKGKTEINIVSLDDKSSIEFIKQCIKFLKNILDEDKNIKETDTDLLNIRDEMLSIFNQTLYLFTFN